MHEYHVEPWWYFAPVLLVGCMPSSLFLVPFVPFLFDRSSARGPCVRRRWVSSSCRADSCDPVFHVSTSKLPPYILPACLPWRW